MRLLSGLEQGLPVGDDLNDIHPDILSQYYGIEGAERRRKPGQTGAGHYDDDEDDEEPHNPEGYLSSSASSNDEIDTTSSDSTSLHQGIAQDQDHHIRHPPVPVPKSRCPFQLDKTLQLFRRTLADVAQKGLVPQGYALRPSEWPSGGYGNEERMKLGRRGKQLKVVLPFDIWWQRAVRWAQGHEIMTTLLMIEAEELV